MIFLIMIILVSCNNQHPPSGSNVPSAYSDTTGDKILKTSDSTELVFDFYYRFCSDTAFQLERIKFPIAMEKDNEYLSVQKTGWKHDNLFLNLQYTTRIAGVDDAEFDYGADYGDRSVFSWIYPSLNKRKDYYFIREHNLWYLSKITVSKMDTEDPESFIIFLQRYMNDSGFQVSRTKFPFRISTWTGYEEENRDTTYFVELSGWNFFSLYNGLDSLTNFVNGWDPVIKENDKLNLHVGGMENGLSVTYHFEKTGDKWFLTGLQDDSD